jgi:hypothetical protein
MKRFSLTSLVGKLQLLFLRFPVTLLLIVCVAVLSFRVINIHSLDIPYCWWIFFAVGAVISLVVVLGTEDLVNCLWQYGMSVVAVMLWGVYCMFLPPENDYYFDSRLQTGIITAVFSLAVFFVSFLRKNRETAFWSFSREIIVQAAIAGLFGLVLFGGLCLAVYSLDILFGVNVNNDVYVNLLVVCFILFSPVYFLSNIPDKNLKYEGDTSFHRAIKIFGLYIMSPILGVYTLILYVYLARIVVIWELPNGWVSFLVSALAVGGLLILLLLYPVYLRKEDRVAVFLSRYFGLLLMPLLALMTVGIFRRIGDYGLTINRCYVLLLNVWFYAIFIYLYFSRSRHIKWILISPAVILLLVSVGPWRVSRITQIALQNRLETCFSQLDFAKDGKISLYSSSDFFKNLDKEEKEKIGGPLRYLAETYGLKSVQQFFVEDISKKSGYEIINALNLRLRERDYVWFSVRITDVYFQNIDGYKSFAAVAFEGNSGDTGVSFQNNCLHYKSKVDDRNFSIPLEESLSQLIRDEDRRHLSLPFSPENKAYTVRGEQYSFLITNVDGYLYSKTTDSLNINSIRGYLFYK